MKTINIPFLIKHDACPNGIKAFKRYFLVVTDLSDVIKKAKELNKWDWIIWLVVRVMTKDQCDKFALFCAQSALNAISIRNPVYKDDSQNLVIALAAYLRNRLKINYVLEKYNLLESRKMRLTRHSMLMKAAILSAADCIIRDGRSSAFAELAEETAMLAIYGNSSLKPIIIDYGLELLEIDVKMENLK